MYNLENGKIRFLMKAISVVLCLILTVGTLSSCGKKTAQNDPVTDIQVSDKIEDTNDDTVDEQQGNTSFEPERPEEITQNIVSTGNRPTQTPVKKPIQTKPEQTTPADPEQSVPEITPPVEEKKGTVLSGQVTVENDTVSKDASFTDGTVSAKVPAGVQVENSVSNLTLTITPKENSDSGISLEEGQAIKPLDVHMDGVSADNTQPITICLGAVLPVGMNLGNVSMYHVENGSPNSMVQVMDLKMLKNHNQFYYEPATGNITVAMATFSEVAMLYEAPKWEGEYDYSWYSVNADEYYIANADQLAAFSRIVGGMGITRDSFAGKTVKLVADINLNDSEYDNKSDLLFEPIGYYYTEDKNNDGNTGDLYSTVYSFCGTFDGQGHTIANFYQNTWEIKGDYSGNYYSDAMGLFGYVVNGKVQNLTVDNFSSDGEFTPTGVIAAYSVNSEFKNIAITNCNPRVYNTGNGGIVGIAGNSSDTDELKLTFTNITVDNTNKISALWGSWDVACGGLMGMFRGYSKVNMTNCHVAAQIDVFNDVCGNYQYYWYRYSGMLIGSLRGRNITDSDGYVVPNMTGITASSCTVHFGEWNDYYYCELVANSLASYTHDHQFSRLEPIENITDIKDGENWLKTGNYMLGSECYHIVKDDEGNLVQHLHSDAGEETVNGEIVPKEDKTLVYLPFNQLFQGDGWGVKHIPIYDNEEDNVFSGVKVLDRYDAESVIKFESTGLNSVVTGQTVTLNELFGAKENCEVAIQSGGVQIAVTDIGDTGVSAVFEQDENDWKNSTLSFSGTGMVQLTIQDYYFCVPTALTLQVVEARDYFETVLPNTDKYLYRVGNNNTITLGLLFGKQDENLSIYSDVTVNAVSLINQEIVLTANVSKTDWQQKTIQFDTNFTGPVAVTVSALGANDYTLYLEVVEGNNISSVSGSSGTDVILLKDVTISSNGTAHYSNCTVYGNGFTFDVRGGMNQYNSKQGHGIIITSNVILDNLVILGDVYDQYGAYTTQEDYTSAIDATNSVIQNCHISNCSTPIRANGVTVKNTTLYGGTVANIIISGGVNTLENVTTVNYNDGRGVVGFGIVISDGASESTKLVLNGSLKQYNFVCEDDGSGISDDIAGKLFNAMFDSAYSKYHFTKDSKTYVNPGILSMVDTFNADDVTDNTGNGYAWTAVTYMGAGGNLYAMPAEGNSIDNGYVVTNDVHKANIQGDYEPTFTFDLGDQMLSNDGEDDTRYLIGNAQGIEALYQNNENPINLDLTKLASVVKYSHGGQYKLSASYKDINGNVLGTDTIVPLTSSGTLVFTVADDVFYGQNGEKLEKTSEKTYVVNVTVSIKQAAVKNATINVTKTNLTGTYTKAGTFDTSQYLSFNPLEAITVTDYDANGTGTTVNLAANISGTTVTYANTTAGAWGGATITMTYTDGRVLTIVLGSSSMNSPGASNGGKTITVTNGTVKSDGKVAKSSATGGTWPITSYSFKGNNGSTVSTNQTVTVTFTDVNSGGGSSGCFAEGTMIMLADGTSKPVEQITYDDQLLAWDLNTGKYAVTTPSLIESHDTSDNRVINLRFADGTVARIIVDHGFFSVDENNFVFLSEENVDDYIGKEFVKVGENGTYTTTKLIGYEITQEQVSYYTIQTAMYNNCIAENMFTLNSPPIGFDGWFDYFEIGEGMKYDEAKKQADIEKYGLYTYDDFAEYVTYEQFIAFNGPYLKVLVGKGVLTYGQILELIATYVVA